MQLFIIPNTKQDASSVATLVDDLHKSFKDWGLKEDGVVLQLREPGKRGQASA